MGDIQVQKITPEDKRISKRKIYAKVCYYYPRYSLKDVEAMPARDINLLLKTAQEEQAGLLYNLTLIVQSPHTKRQANVKKLLDHFKKIAGR